jgi:DNA-binding HxlR family transcriptional regulator
MARIINRLPAQPVERALKALSGRWKALTVYHLGADAKRFSTLQANLGDVTSQVLTRQLRELESHGVVSRSHALDAQPRYQLTELGLDLLPLLAGLCAWGQAQAQTVGEAGKVRDCVIRSRAPQGVAPHVT